MRSLLINSIVLILAFTLADAYAEKSTPLSPDDFAYGAPLSTAKSSLRKFYPGPEILKNLTRSDAGDIRIYDDNNRVVPAYVRQTESEEVQSDEILEYYPLYHTIRDNTQVNSLDIVRNEQNEIKQLISSVKALPSELKISGYLIDQSGNENNKARQLSTLLLGWQQDTHPELLQVRVEHCSDLDNWRLAHSSITISNLRFQGQILKQNTITFAKPTHRFIKLTFLHRDKALTLESVTGSYRQVSSRGARWSSLGTLRKDPKEVNSYRFTVNRGLTPSRLRFVFPTTDSLMSGTLYSLNKQKKRWTRRYSSMSQYKVSFGDSDGNSATESSPIHFPRTNETEWKFVSDADNGINEDQLPQVEITYPSYEISFVAQGTEPYRATWGNFVARKQSTNMQQLIKDAALQGKDIELVQIGKIEAIRGPDALTGETGVQWKSWLLWFVMLAGVLMVARLAYQLYREMNESI